MLLVGALGDGRGGSAPARQLLGQPPHRGGGVARPRGRAVRARPGRGPDVPGARPLGRRGAGTQAGRGRARPAAGGGRARGDAAPGRGAAHRLPRRPGRPEGDAGGDPARRARRRSEARRCCATTPSQGRAGWKAIVAAPGDGTAVRSTAPSGDPTNGLRSYPQDALSSPLDQRRATFAVRPGGGTLEAPESPGAGATTTTSRGSDGLTGRVRRRRLRRGSAAAPAARRVRLGSAARTFARAREGDGGRIPDRHARHRAARVRARRHGHDHPHDRCLRARARDAAAVAVHPARGPLPLADPGFGAAGGAWSGSAC